MSKRNLESKVVFLGATSVGKTCIISRIVSDEFDTDVPSTVGSCYYAKEIETDKANVMLQLWDTAGQERFRTLAPMYYRSAVVAVIVFSVTKPATLQDVKNWLEEIRKECKNVPVLFVVGNKIDLVDERQISPSMGEELADELGAIYYEVSAKSGIGIDELFVRIAEESLERIGDDEQMEKKIELKETKKERKKRKKRMKKNCC